MMTHHYSLVIVVELLHSYYIASYPPLTAHHPQKDRPSPPTTQRQNTGKSRIASFNEEKLQARLPSNVRAGLVLALRVVP
jgi:hypothetical protein